MKQLLLTVKKSVVYFLFITAVISSGCSFDTKPEPTSQAYNKAVSDFYLSLAAMQADEALFAIEKMQAVADQYPKEAAAWANLGLYAMRQADLELAAGRVDKALQLAPGNSEIQFLAGNIASRRGNVNEAISHYTHAVRADSSHLKALYALAGEMERQGNADREEVYGLYDQILERDGGNLAVLVEKVRLAAKWQHAEVLESSLSRLANVLENGPEEVKEQIEQLQESAPGSDLTVQITFLRNALNQMPEFQSDLSHVRIPPNEVGNPIFQFTWLPEPIKQMADKDDQLSFSKETLAEGSGYELLKPVSLSDENLSEWIAVKSGKAMLNGATELSFPGRALSRHAVTGIDYNYDFRNDLAFAGREGFKLYQQQDDGTFEDITSSLNIPPAQLNRSYHGLWSRDIDLDGDLDLVMSASGGAVSVFRNNGDGTFRVRDVFNGISGLVAFEWADLDGDADADAVLLTADGSMHILQNERSGAFTHVDKIADISGVVDIEIADINSDGRFELLAWTGKGIETVSYNPESASWERGTSVATKSGSGKEAGTASLFAVDIDNNGGTDLLVSDAEESRYWLSDKDLRIAAKSTTAPAGVQGFADSNDDTRLDLFLLTEGGEANIGLNGGSKDYLARLIRPRASGPVGDQRINSFGIGGEIEMRSGLIYQKKQINGSWVHLGLGTYDEAEMLRIIWPNGSSQTEFAELGYDSKILNEQTLKGSCPWLFAYNGEQMEFVTDFIWRSPLGLRINAQATAGVVQTEDRVKIRGDQLKKKDGYYELRITADLWETHFFDQVSLMAVDHPEDTEVYVDERFAIPAPDLSVRPTAPPQQVASVTDDRGKDVSEVVSKIDRDYLYPFDHTQYQGVAEDHYIEIDIGKEAPTEGPLWLLAHGWVRPTDSSINYAISQGSNPGPRGLSLEVSDGKGGWTQVQSNLGFPAGKSKTIMINLQDVFVDNADRRVRLHTTTETYWDAIMWAQGLPQTKIRRRVLPSQKMELRYRGFSEITQKGMLLPEMPNYQNISGTTAKWYDLEGFYTRFGDVTELLQKVDDRYVIMNAGDEMVLRFKAPEAPPVGWKRDFVLIGDGWVKDGDYNTKFSETVLPLPSHHIDQYQYDEAPERLEDDPIYRKHAADWVNYHTRYITPREFQTALTFDN